MAESLPNAPSAAITEDWTVFKKPGKKDTLPTPHVQVGVGTLHDGFSPNGMLKALCRFGPVRELCVPTKKPFCFATFTTPAHAAAACKALDGSDVAGLGMPAYVRHVCAKRGRKAPEPVSSETPLDLSGATLLEERLPPSACKMLHSAARAHHKQRQTLLRRRARDRSRAKNSQPPGAAPADVANDQQGDEDAALPDFVSQSLLPELAKLRGWKEQRVNYANIRVLNPGQGIKDTVLSHSRLGPRAWIVNMGQSPVVMRWCADQRSKQVILAGGATLLLEGESRMKWAHGVEARTRDIVDGVTAKRGVVALCTLAEQRDQPIACDCEYAASCDSQTPREEKKPKKVKSKVVSPAIDEKVVEQQAAALEREHVHKVYDAIAGHFSHTRYQAWPKVEQFVQAIPANSLVADVGCGNGKYMGVNKSIRVIGCDTSRNLLEICRGRGYEVLQGDATALPYRSNAFDHAMCIAVLHHISSEPRRLRVISELIRILKVGGRVLLTAWAQEQCDDSRREFQGRDVFVAWNVPRHHTDPAAVLDGEAAPKAEGGASIMGSEASTASEEVGGDRAALGKEKAGAEGVEGSAGKQWDSQAPAHLQHAQYDERKNAVVFQRYCHVYRKGELEGLFAQVPGCRVVNSYFDTGNWCIVAERIQ